MNIADELHFLRNDIQRLGDALMIIARNQHNTCVAPTFSFNNATGQLTITSSTSGATIFYTTDGTTPTIQSNVYSAAISITEPKTVKAFAVKLDMNDSAVSTIEISQVATPTTSVSGNNLSAACATTGATIKHGTSTSESTEPQNYSDYSAAINLTQDSVTTYHWFKAVKDGMVTSGATKYKHEVVVAKPTHTVNTENNTITPACATTGATIKWGTSLNQSTQPTEWNTYSSPISMAGALITTYYWFKAEKAGCTTSELDVYEHVIG